METTHSSVSQAATKVKVVMLGDHSTGKTSVISRFLNDKFDQESSATVGIDFLAKNVYSGKSVVRLQLWDTAGQERFRSLIPNYLKDAMVAILVFDVSNRNSFDNLTEWFQLFKENKHNKAHIILVGNKIDLEPSKKAQALGMSYFETSAKSAANIESLFTQVARLYASDSLADSNIMDTSMRHPTVREEVPKAATVQLQPQKQYQKAQQKRKCCHI